MIKFNVDDAIRLGVSGEAIFNYVTKKGTAKESESRKKTKPLSNKRKGVKR